MTRRGMIGEEGTRVERAEEKSGGERRGCIGTWGWGRCVFVYGVYVMCACARVRGCVGGGYHEELSPAHRRRRPTQPSAVLGTRGGCCCTRNPFHPHVPSDQKRSLHQKRSCFPR